MDIKKAMARLEKLLAANPEIPMIDGGKVCVVGATDVKIRRKAIMDCIEIVKDCGGCQCDKTVTKLIA